MLRVIFMVFIMIIIIIICVGKCVPTAYAFLTIWNKWLLYNKAAQQRRELIIVYKSTQTWSREVHEVRRGGRRTK